MVLPGKHLGNTVVSSACVDICKEQNVLTLQWQPINAQDLTMIHTFHMNDQSIVSSNIYWILETRELSIDLTLREIYSATLMLILQVDRNMVITTLWNQYYRAKFFIMYARCRINWGRKMQTEIALSTIESEYIALSTPMLELIPFTSLMK